MHRLPVRLIIILFYGGGTNGGYNMRYMKYIFFLGGEVFPSSQCNFNVCRRRGERERERWMRSSVILIGLFVPPFFHNPSIPPSTPPSPPPSHTHPHRYFALQNNGNGGGHCRCGNAFATDTVRVIDSLYFNCLLGGAHTRTHTHHAHTCTHAHHH